MLQVSGRRVQHLTPVTQSPGGLHATHTQHAFECKALTLLFSSQGKLSCSDHTGNHFPLCYDILCFNHLFSLILASSLPHTACCVRYAFVVIANFLVAC